jgi:hypothetical protein
MALTVRARLITARINTNGTYETDETDETNGAYEADGGRQEMVAG